MLSSNHLFQALQKHFNWHPSRTKCLLLILHGMIQSRSVQSQQIAAHFPGKIELSSSVKRIERLWAEQLFDFGNIARLIVEILGHEGPFHLILDRTNWKFGETDINYLVLALRIEGVGAIPLLWTVLPKKGNSNTGERIDLMKEFFKIFPDAQIGSFAGDREFVGKDWIHFLVTKQINFYIRIKSNRLVDWGGTPEHVGTFFEHLRVKEARKIYKHIDGYDLQFVGTRSKDNKLVIILTNVDENPKRTLAFYKERWCIETLFKNLKSNGINLEGTHLKTPERLKKLLGVCAIVTALCTRAGIDKNNQKPIPFRKTVGALLYSVFQYGLNAIRKLFGAIIQQILVPTANAMNLKAAEEES